MTHDEAIAGMRELAADMADAAKRLEEALRNAIRQNSHDMVMTGEEIRLCESALAAMPKEPT